MSQRGIIPVSPLFEIQIKISFKTDFHFQYFNEEAVEKNVIRFGDFYSREFFFNVLPYNFFCMLFVNNKEYQSDQKVEMILLNNNKQISNKFFHISNNLPYDGWFILEKEIK